VLGATHLTMLPAPAYIRGGRGGEGGGEGEGSLWGECVWEMRRERALCIFFLLQGFLYVYMRESREREKPHSRTRGSDRESALRCQKTRPTIEAKEAYDRDKREAKETW
jgi:hypothetical protein